MLCSCNIAKQRSIFHGYLLSLTAGRQLEFAVVHLFGEGDPPTEPQRRFCRRLPLLDPLAQISAATLVLSSAAILAASGAIQQAGAAQFRQHPAGIESGRLAHGAQYVVDHELPSALRANGVYRS